MSENLKAVIMAGGEGSRLRPLTCNIPKPMARICGKPAIERILDLLGCCGVTEASVSLMYLPQSVRDNFPTGEYNGIKLKFTEEPRPLGSAGGVKNAANGFKEDFIVISGDAICDFSLDKAYEYHKKSGCAATIIAKRVKEPGEYGMISEESGRVKGFIEKPAYSQVTSDIANTGVYILSPECLSMIPDGEKYDFSGDLFPKLFSEGKGIAVWEEQGYWKDIGSPNEYIACQADMLYGRARIITETERDKNGNVLMSDTSGAVIIPPVYVGKEVFIGEGAVIESGSVIEDGAKVEALAHIKGAVIGRGAHIGELASVTGAIVCEGAFCGTKSMMFEGAVLGPFAYLGKNSRMNPGIKVWQGKHVCEDRVVDTHLKYGECVAERFDEDGILPPENCVAAQFYAKAGAAIASALGGKLVAAASDGGKGAGCAADALISGMQCSGCDTVDFGDIPFGVFVFGMIFAGAANGVYISGKNRRVRVFEKGGLPAKRTTEREIEKAMNGGEFLVKRQEEYGFHIKLPEITELYKARLREAARKAFAGRKVTLDADDGRIKDIFEGLFSDSAPEESRVTFSGEKVSLSEDGRTLNDDELTELCILSEFDKGKSAALKYSAPCIFDELAAEYGGKTERYFECPADDGDRKARELAEDEAWERDPVIRLIVAAGYLREKKLTVADASKIIKPVKRESASVETGGINPGRIVNDITSGDASAKAGEGKVLKVGNGYAVVRALKNGSGILVTAESDRYETAREICGELIKKVERRKKDILDS